MTPIGDPEHPVPLGELGQRMGMTVVSADPQCVVLAMPVAGNTQPYGLLHGGASAALVETAASIGSAMHAGPGAMVVGLDLTCTHHRAVREGVVTATATPLSLGRSIASYDVRVTDEQGRAVCTGRLTCLIRPLPAE